MADTARASDPGYLRSQYGDTERLRIREHTHHQYSEGIFRVAKDAGCFVADC